jgi:hypothetical protein
MNELIKIDWMEWIDSGECETCKMDFAYWIVKDTGQKICRVCGDSVEVSA